MATYAISDIHGCFGEFMALLSQIQFNPNSDVLYVLGDAIDRGEQPIDCLQYIKQTKNVHYILGNHEIMMLDYFNSGNGRFWGRYGGHSTFDQIELLTITERDKIIAYLRKRPLYKTVNVNGRRYFLSHAGLDAALPFNRQSQEALLWGYERFYPRQALNDYICVFGHITTPTLREGVDSLFEHRKGSYTDCSVWLDTRYNDKIGIDSACVFGGALSALRLEDGAIFYEKAHSDRGNNYSYTNASIPESFFNGRGLQHIQSD